MGYIIMASAQQLTISNISVAVVPIPCQDALPFNKLAIPIELMIESNERAEIIPKDDYSTPDR
jgi:pseudouridine-5'-phosphate glycosidase